MITDARAASPEIDFSTFPETDGKPMAESEINLEQMIDLILTLRSLLAPHGHHVGGNLLTYWNPANGNEHIAPDVFVALDAGPARRRTWLVWEDGKFPEVVFEIASPSTRNRDIRDKVAQYDQLGVHEYYIFDPLGRLDPAFRGYARQGGSLMRVPNPAGTSITSRVLGLELRVVAGWLRVIDPATGEPYPTVEEERAGLQADLRAAQARVRQAEAQAEEEARARRAAEQARRAAERARLAAEAQAAREEQARRAVEAQNAQMAADLARLREMLARLGLGDDGAPRDAADRP